MYELRQILVRMRLGDSDRALAKAGLIGRPKAKALRRLAEAEGWLDPERPLPEDAVLAEALSRARQRSSSVSSVEPFRDKVEQWVAHDIPCRAIHQALKREHHYTGSYSSVYRFVQGVKPSQAKATVPLEFAAGEAAQIDFGSGPELIDAETGEVVKTAQQRWQNQHRGLEQEDRQPQVAISPDPGCACLRLLYEGATNEQGSLAEGSHRARGTAACRRCAGQQECTNGLGSCNLGN